MEWNTVEAEQSIALHAFLHLFIYMLIVSNALYSFRPLHRSLGNTKRLRAIDGFGTGNFFQ
jgi:hypothetical protein